MQPDSAQADQPSADPAAADKPTADPAIADPAATKKPDPEPAATKHHPPHLAEPELTYLTAERFDEFHFAVQRGFQEEIPEEAREFDRRFFEPERFFGFEVDGRWIATCGAFSRKLTVPGGAAVPTAAVTVVTVHPPYRRRGLLTKMMKHQLEDAHRRGEPVALLWASESLIYGRYGYGPAAPRVRMSGDTRSTRYLPSVDLGNGSVDEVSKELFLQEARRIHLALLPQRPGALDRDNNWWDYITYDFDHARNGATALRYLLHYNESGEPDGFATYRVKEGFEPTGPNAQVLVNALDSASTGGYARLWRYLFDLDLVRRFSKWNSPPDDPIRSLLADARAIQTELTDGTYLRVLDVKTALPARRYSAELDLVIEIADDILEHNNGRFRIQAGPDGATITPSTEQADLSLGILELGTIYLGGPTLAQLHRAGRVVEHRPGAVAEASAAFSWPVAPWCPDMF